MKKQSFMLRACIILAVLTAVNFSANSQKTKLPKLSPAEEKEWASVETEEDALQKLSAADKADGKEKGQAALAYLLKALLHRADPATYPIDDKADSPEKTALDAIDKFSPTAIARGKTKVLALMTDARKRASMLGKFKDIDFKKKSITPDLKKLGNLQFKPAMRGDRDEASVPQEQISISPMGFGAASVDEVTPVFTKMDMVIKRIRCMDETNPEDPGDDDMVIGGIRVGASGNTVPANTLISCHFDDGDVCNHGAFPFGAYNLAATSSYPKTIYCILILVEVDTDERDAANMLTNIMNGVAATVSGYNATIGAVVAAVADAVDEFSGWFFDDDIFHPYGIARTLNSANEFGSDGKSPDKITGNISDHGGTYKIRYYWQMR